MNPFTWNEKSEKALALWVQGDLTFQEIADEAGVARRTIYIWRNHPEFRARYDEELAEFRSEIRRLGIGTVERRVQALNDRHKRIARIINARAKDPHMVDAPGGDTGLYIKQARGVGKGKDFKVVYDFVVDTNLLKEIREIERQAAQELGQWNLKSDESELDIRLAIDLTRSASESYRDPDDLGDEPEDLDGEAATDAAGASPVDETDY